MSTGMEERYRETTQPTLSNFLVGIADIYARDLPDSSGGVASRMSGLLVISDPETRQSREETVIEGSIVTIGADRYCVTRIEEGKHSPGWLSLRKL